LTRPLRRGRIGATTKSLREKTVDHKTATAALAALGQETRLETFRLLLKAGPGGVSAGAVADVLAVPPNTLSFHLSHLVNAGLAVQRREGRSIIYTAETNRFAALLHHLSGFCDTTTEGRVMTQPHRLYNVLFLCTGNSARSILAEAAMTRWGAGRFQSFSAGSHPKGEVHPMTLKTLTVLNYKADGYRSKSWDEFAAPGAPPLDFVFTVCDNAAGEVCPIWPGQPMTAHWGVEDPAAATGSEASIAMAFRRAYFELENRIKIFTSLRLEGLDHLTLQGKLNTIGKAKAEQPGS
jgi:ArsR family transcriptional regulator, arsenate/arsenite/antimonite-responsive transcriptional repressor / arsenate reductase (thioredoxin)